jgi:hypothetical protein
VFVGSPSLEKRKKRKFEPSTFMRIDYFILSHLLAVFSQTTLLLRFFGMLVCLGNYLCVGVIFLVTTIRWYWQGIFIAIIIAGFIVRQWCGVIIVFIIITGTIVVIIIIVVPSKAKLIF